MLWKRSKPQFNKFVRIGNRIVGEGQPCFIIAEAGSNHNQKFHLAKRLIDTAARAKADAVKFQVFVPEKIYVKNAGFADYLGRKKTIQQIFHDIMMPKEWLPKLAEYCSKKKIMFLSSAFDEESVNFIDNYVAAHKIASYEATHLPLVRHIAKKGKPIILSVGMASIDEIKDALKVIASTGNKNVIIMHCISKYPTPIEASNLRIIDTLRREFGVPIGISDHTREPIITPVAAVARGGNIVEKHFTLSNKLPGPDHGFALEPKELLDMVKSIRKTELALGSSTKQVQEIEKELYTFARRRVHATRNIKKGEIFTKQNIAVLRSGKARPGLEPKYYEWVLGRRAKNDIKESEGVRKDDVV